MYSIYFVKLQRYGKSYKILLFTQKIKISFIKCGIYADFHVIIIFINKKNTSFFDIICGFIAEEDNFSPNIQ